MAKKRDWLEAIREEHRAFLEKHNLNPVRYHYIKQDDKGRFVEYQKEEGGPVFVRRGDRWVEKKERKRRVRSQKR